ncbi:hypothetical protein [Sphingomonas sp. GC_Shp_3]|uniref:hypothetical protein n=1 Tax=Sphingomonas sp. GC_Shp_3 TaxID=2937383 RepID=UPI00226AE1AB|nr:hypothetical protein [Sphingomonas sp. GC_Shp_3]
MTVAAAVPSAENHWELRVERLVPRKRHVAYRVLINRIAEWWWHPFPTPKAQFIIDWRAGEQFRIISINGTVTQSGVIMRIRRGWYFYMTDAVDFACRPGRPSMVCSWSIRNTPKDDPRRLPNECATLVSTIRHFSEEDYQRNLALGLERGWNESADRFAEMCKERIAY